MELLPQGQTNTTEVLWEDQQKINQFSSLISQKDTLAAEKATFQTEKEYIEDLALEIELLDSDEKVQYKIGDAFVFLDVSRAVEMVEKENQRLEEKISAAAEAIEEIDAKLAELKAHLYSKFGKNINLERD